MTLNRRLILLLRGIGETFYRVFPPRNVHDWDTGNFSAAIVFR